MRSPSSTARFVTRPIVSALMLTNFFGWILPDAETSASRSRDLIVSTLTVTPSTRLNLKLAKAIAPRMTTTPAPISSFFLPVMPPPSGS